MGVACSAIPAGLAESELFGHERGAFTGALRLHAGAFERADGGTLLLDDVDDLPLRLQGLLLRVLQERCVHRVGGARELPVDVRVIATTKLDRVGAVEQGRFRPDLYYRLRGLEIELPPLRDRMGDLPAMVTHFLARRQEREGSGPTAIGPRAMTQLLSHAWPGNVRELRHAVEAAAALCRGERIEVCDLPVQPRTAAARPIVDLDLEGRDALHFGDIVRRVEDSLVCWAMDRAGGNQTVAASLLNLPLSTFQTKLRR